MVKTKQGVSIQCAQVILSIGGGKDNLNIPDWASPYMSNNDLKLQHIFSDGFSDPVQLRGSMIVVGGGMTGVQYAIKCAELGRLVKLITRQDIQVHQFDSDPCWLGPKCLRWFHQISNPNSRRIEINKARQIGSVNNRVKAKLDYWVKCGKIEIISGHIKKIEKIEDELKVFINDEVFVGNHIVLATGYRKKRPGGQLISNLIAENKLPISECEYPVVNRNLMWGNKVFVSGALADLELGPAARNISGARMAAERIVSYFKQ